MWHRIVIGLALLVALPGLMASLVAGEVASPSTASAGLSDAAPPEPAVGNSETAAKDAGNSQSNIILLLIDDERALEFEIGFGRRLPESSSALERDLIDQGTMFDNFFNSTAYCCPSRASYLTGMYSHNHLIYGNNYNVSMGNGGWRRFWELGYEANSLGKWMQDAGYKTVLIGKFLNQYPNIPGNFVPEEYVPIGWDEWYGSFTNDIPFSYYQFRMNENGVVARYGDVEPAYLTDVERDHAVDFIERVGPGEQPFFMYLAPFSPHGPIEPALRHVGLHDLDEDDVATPPSFNEEDLSDKPQFVRDSAFEYPAFWNTGWNLRLDMSLAIDEMIAAVVDELEAQAIENDTYLFFTSDNGLLWGEHRISGKALAYEESLRAPLIVRGPGVAQGVARRQLTQNVDLPATILDLAGADQPPTVDGESLVGLMFGDSSTLQSWRSGVLAELLLAGPSLEEGDDARSRGIPATTVPAYSGIRTLGHLYVEYETGERELYDMVLDPYQMESLHDSAPAEILTPLQDALHALRDCAGAACAAASRLPVPNARPQSLFTFSCEGLECVFNASASYDVDGEIVDYRWDFGDGSPLESGVIVSHTFGAVDNYFVELVVEDDAGDTGTQIQLVAPGADIFTDGFESGDTSRWL